MEQKEFVKTLRELSAGNAEYAAFNKRIVNTGKNLIGVRTPDMRKLAQKIAKGMDAAAIRAFLSGIDKNSFEQVMVSGFVIQYAKLTDAERIALTKKYLENVDSWGLIDSFTHDMKTFDAELWWNFAMECLNADEEFTVRAGVMRLFVSYLDEPHLPDVFEALRSVKHEGYYVKMATAWLYAEAASFAFAETIEELDRPETNAWTRGKALQKMLESRRISDEQKAFIRDLRKITDTIS